MSDIYTQKSSGPTTNALNMFCPRKVFREPYAKILKVMHSFNWQAIEVKGWTGFRN